MAFSNPSWGQCMQALVTCTMSVVETLTPTLTPWGCWFFKCPCHSYPPALLSLFHAWWPLTLCLCSALAETKPARNTPANWQVMSDELPHFERLEWGGLSVLSAVTLALACCNSSWRWSGAGRGRGSTQKPRRSAAGQWEESASPCGQLKMWS